MNRIKLVVFLVAAVAILGVQLLTGHLVQHTELLYWVFPILAFVVAGAAQAYLRHRLMSATVTALVFVAGAWLVFPGNKMLWTAVFVIISFKAALVVDLWLLLSKKPR